MSKLDSACAKKGLQVEDAMFATLENMAYSVIKVSQNQSQSEDKLNSDKVTLFKKVSYNEEQSKRPIRTFPYVNEVTLRGQKPPLKCC